ncbi:MAG: outer membrane protein assembly factor BamE [Lautropia sp.]|nr:outer membrane protein assembly factor BamE [Lautropia sp.]
MDRSDRDDASCGAGRTAPADSATSSDRQGTEQRTPGRRGGVRGWGWALLLALMPLGACDFVAQQKLAPGESTEADVRRWMGQPEMTWEESDGSRTLEYPRGPRGKETYFVTIGADGRYRSIRQVLTEENFQRLAPGMSRDAVRQVLGKPGEIERFSRQHEEVWSWRYLGTDTRTMFFNAYFDQDTGRLKRTDSLQDRRTMRH